MITAGSSIHPMMRIVPPQAAQLGGLARSRLATHDDNLVIADRSCDLVAFLADRKRLGIRNLGLAGTARDASARRQPMRTRRGAGTGRAHPLRLRVRWSQQETLRLPKMKRPMLVASVRYAQRSQSKSNGSNCACDNASHDSGHTIEGFTPEGRARGHSKQPHTLPWSCYG